jgi:hypothetical protein
MSPRSLVPLLGLVLLTAGCQRDRPEPVNPPTVGEAFPTVLMPPGGSISAQNASQDALQMTFLTPQPVDRVAAYYRHQFSQAGWVIVSDLADSAGAVDIHVNWEQSGQPMWVRISKAPGGTQVDLIGAVPGRDTTFARKQREARDSSNVLRPR